MGSHELRPEETQLSGGFSLKAPSGPEASPFLNPRSDRRTDRRDVGRGRCRGLRAARGRGQSTLRAAQPAAGNNGERWNTCGGGSTRGVRTGTSPRTFERRQLHHPKDVGSRRAAGSASLLLGQISAAESFLPSFLPSVLPSYLPPFSPSLPCLTASAGSRAQRRSDRWDPAASSRGAPMAARLPSSNPPRSPLRC